MQNSADINPAKIEFSHNDFAENQARTAFSSFGVKIVVQTNYPQFLEQNRSFIPSLAKPLGADERADYIFSVIWDDSRTFATHVYRNEEKLYSGRQINLVELLIILEGQIRVTIAEFSPNFVFLHSGAVAFNGNVIVIPGQSFSGKTTLTAAFVKKGALYFSDELVALDEWGYAYPFAKPLSIREGSPNDFQTPRSVESLGGKQATEPSPINLVIIPEYCVGENWQPERLSPGDAVLEIMKHSISVRTNPELTIKVLSRVAQNALILKGKRGEAEALVESIIQSLSMPLRRAA